MKKIFEDGTIGLIETFALGQNNVKTGEGTLYVFDDKTGDLKKIETGFILRCALGSLSDTLGTKTFLYKMNNQKDAIIYKKGVSTLVRVENEEEIADEIMMTEKLQGPFENAELLLEHFHNEEDPDTLTKLKEHFVKTNGSLENWVLSHDERILRKGKYYITET